MKKYDAIDRFGKVQKESMLESTVAEYNEEGRMIVFEGIKYALDGSIQLRGTYKYDAEGNEAEHIHYDSIGSNYVKKTVVSLFMHTVNTSVGSC